MNSLRRDRLNELNMKIIIFFKTEVEIFFLIFKIFKSEQNWI